MADKKSKKKEDKEEVVEVKEEKKSSPKLSPEEMWKIHTEEMATKPKWTCQNRKEPIYTYHAKVVLVEEDRARDDNKFEMNEPLSLEAIIQDKSGSKDWYPVSGVELTIVRPDKQQMTRETNEEGKIYFKPYMLGDWMFIARDIEDISVFKVV